MQLLELHRSLLDHRAQTLEFEMHVFRVLVLNFVSIFNYLED